MKSRILGHTDLDLGVIGLGCMGFSHAYGPAMPEEQAVSAIREAFDMGYRFFDTAAVYAGTDTNGKRSVNEVLVGKALHDVRDQVIIATKYGIEESDGPLKTDGSIETLRKSLAQSLKNLQTDYIDLFYLHRIDPAVPVEEVAAEMKRQIEAGTIRGWGLSEATIEEIERANAVCPLSAVQNRYSMMARQHEPVIRRCAELGITFVAFSPLANGFLSGAYNHAVFEGKEDFRSRMPQFTKEGQKELESLSEQLGAIAAEHNCTPAQLSLAWMCALHDNLIPIPGTTKVSRMKENFTAQNVTLSPETLAQINTLLDKDGSLPVYGGRPTESKSR